MRKLIIEIDCEETTCGACKNVRVEESGIECGMFSEQLLDETGRQFPTKPMRLKECLAAEAFELGDIDLDSDH